MTWALLSLVLATPNFPAELQRVSGAPSAPACTVCHRGTPALGTVQTPFGVAMRGGGLVADKVPSLEGAWTQLGDHDSDGDGVTDKQELAQGQDPNGDSFAYGCTGAPSTGEVGSGLGLLWGAWCRQRRRRSRLRLQ